MIEAALNGMTGNGRTVGTTTVAGMTRERNNVVGRDVSGGTMMVGGNS
jgi:hypothetical protein